MVFIALDESIAEMKSLLDMLKNWWAWMSCALWTGFGFWSVYFNKAASAQIKGYFALAVVSLIFASFQTLWVQRKRITELESDLDVRRPNLVFIVTSLRSNKWFDLAPNGMSVFSLAHVSGDAVKHVQVEPILDPGTSKTLVWELRFQKIDFLSPSKQRQNLHYRVYVEKWATDRKWDDHDDLTYTFLQKAEDRQRRTEFPVTISYFRNDERHETNYVLVWNSFEDRLEVLPPATRPHHPIRREKTNLARRFSLHALHAFDLKSGQNRGK